MASSSTSPEALRRRYDELRAELDRVAATLASFESAAVDDTTLRALPETAVDALNRSMIPIFGSTAAKLSPYFIVIHQDGKVVFANEEVARAVGAESSDALIGEPVLRFIHPGDVPQVKKRIAKLMRDGGTAPSTVERFVRYDGTYFDVEVSGAMIEFNGRPAIQVVARDVSDAIRARRALQHLVSGTTSTGAAFFRDLTRALCETLNVHDASVVKWEPVGDTLETLAHWSAGKELHPTSYCRVGTPCERVMKHGVYACRDNVQCEFPEAVVLRLLGATSYYGVAIRSASGETVGVLCILDDQPMEKTEWLVPVMHSFALRAGSEFDRLEYQSELEHSELRFRKLFENSHDALLLIDLDTLHVARANQQAFELFGVSPANLPNLSLKSLQLDETRECLHAFLQGVPLHGVIRHGEAKIESRDRGVTRCEVSASRITIDGSSRILVQLRDVTERHEAQQLLQIQHRVLERLARGDDLTACLTTLCREIEHQVPESFATVMTRSTEHATLSLAVAPSLPAEVVDQLEGLLVAPSGGSCAAAAYTGMPVFALDTSTDPAWENAREFARQLGIVSCWSVPFFCDGRVAGTVAISHPTMRRPTSYESAVIAAAGKLASIAAQRESANRRLRRREEQLKGILGTATDVIWSVDRDGRALYFNRPAIGEKLKVGESLMKALPAGWSEPLARAMQHVAKNRLPYQFEVTHETPRGLRWFSFRVGPVVRDGQCDGFTICATETTGQKEVEQQLRVNYERFRALAESAPALIYLLDENGQLSYVNSQWENIFGLPRWSWKDQIDLLGLIHPLDRDRLVARWTEAWEKQERLECEYRVQRPDGETRWVFNISEPLRSSDGSIGGFVGFATDITPLRESAEALQQREAELAHVSRLATMGQMVAELSHEINQPLYSISNYAGALSQFLKSRTTEKYAAPTEWAQRIGKIATDAGEIIRRLRAFTTQPAPDYSWFDLAEVVREAISLLEWQLRRANISLQLDGFSQPLTVQADRIALQQIVVNLIKNACEALSNSDLPQDRIIGVSLRASSDRSADDGVAIVEIRDTGPGLPTSDSHQLFRAFTSFKSGGSGMGLAVSRTIIERHHGQIWARNNDGEGATFGFMIPRRAQREQRAEKGEPT